VILSLANLSPLRAWRDLRRYLANRQPYHWKIMVLCAAIVFALFATFIHDSKIEKDYKSDIIYVQQWPLDRTEAQIVAQQKVDQAARKKRLAAEDAERKKIQAQFKRVDDKLKAWGL